MKRFIPLFLAALSGPLCAEPSDWVAQDGKPIPKSAAVQSSKGFGGMLVVTQDKDWQAKWDALPPGSAVKEILFGQEIHVLPLFASPQADASGNLNVTASIKVKRPNGSTSTEQEVVCASGKQDKEKGNVFLCAPGVVKFVGEGNDAPGLWSVEVRLTDHNRKVELPLKSQFRLKAK